MEIGSRWNILKSMETSSIVHMKFTLHYLDPYFVRFFKPNRKISHRTPISRQMSIFIYTLTYFYISWYKFFLSPKLLRNYIHICVFVHFYKFFDKLFQLSHSIPLASSHFLQKILRMPRHFSRLNSFLAVSKRHRNFNTTFSNRTLATVARIVWTSIVSPYPEQSNSC